MTKLLKTGERFLIPEGCFITEDNGAWRVTELSSNKEFKNGDFLALEKGNRKWLYIFKRITEEGERHYYHFAMRADELSGYCDFNNSIIGIEESSRFMTDYEKQLVVEKLHQEGKDWDEERREIVDWVWEPKIGEKVWLLERLGNNLVVVCEAFDGCRGNVVFQSKQRVEAALELLKNCKHY